MPWPMAPGVLGMARITRAVGPHAARKEKIEAPAAMEIIKAPPCATLASAGASPFSTCGFLATTQAVIFFGPISDGAASKVMALILASFLSWGEGLGSTTITGPTPLASQPLSKAPP